MLKRFIVNVLSKVYKHYGRVADRCLAEMKNCEIGGREWFKWFNKSITASEKQIRIINKLYELRD